MDDFCGIFRRLPSGGNCDKVSGVCANLGKSGGVNMRLLYRNVCAGLLLAFLSAAVSGCRGATDSANPDIWAYSFAVLCFVVAFLVVIVFVRKRGDRERLAVLVHERTAELEEAEKMGNMLNRMSAVFLSQDNKPYETKLSTGVRLIADTMKLDRVSVWRNSETTDGIFTSQVYRWDRESGGATPPTPELVNIPLLAIYHDWKKVLTNEISVNGPVRLMDDAPAFLQHYGVISAFVTPLIINNEEGWGFVLFEDRHDERSFGDKPAEALRSAAFLFVNTIIMNEKEQEIRNTVAKLDAALEKAEKASLIAVEASRAKSDFLSHMSHEIRTPLNAVIGMISIGLSSDDADKKNYCFERADSASKHLLGIINDVLDMSKIEANRFELSNGEIDFERMLMNITDATTVRAEEKKQDLVINLHNNVPEVIEGDELRLSQVIINLLSNAIKFTPEKGTVMLNIEETETIGNEVTLRIEVVDTGIGISQEQQKRLFTLFNQADSSITKEYGGTGLGLAISKRIIELMGGAIWVESELGKGSKFIFTVKVKKTVRKPRTKLFAHIKAEEMRVLAVDDSSETREYFIHVMEALKISCDVASGGEEALGMIRNAGYKPYNIFFVDWQMPEMDGIELTKKIKEINGENSIVIMISVTDWNVIEKEALAAGVKHFVPKPLFPSALVNAINICIGAEPDESAAGQASQAKTAKQHYDFSNHTLLIAEDVEINREIMSAILEETGVAIDYAENGRIAVSIFRDNPGKYSLIMMDINMPEMDGYEATRQIRALDFLQAKDIPIIAMTANVFKEDVERCFESGMNDHTGKPIDMNAILGMLKKYIKNPGEAWKMKNVYDLKQGIAWDEDLLTGNALVDMQHQKIFERLSDIVQSCEDGSDIANLEDTLEFLVNHTIRHFADEEALLLEYGYPDFESHKNMHSEFKESVDSFVQRFKESGSSAELSGDVNRVVVRWLVNHIQNDDKKISEYIRAIQLTSFGE